MGSPKYMSPEQIRGERVDARSDIYSLGVVMYEMVTGRVPFERENTVKVLMAHMHEQVPPIQSHDYPPGLAELLMRCLAKRPEDRPSSMDEVILMLKQATGLALTMSGAFALSQELRLGASPGLTQSGRLPGGTPSNPYVSGAHSLPYGTLGGDVMNPLLQTGMHAHPGTLPAPMVSQPPPPSTSWLPRIVALSALLIAAGFLTLRFLEHKPVQPSAENSGPPSAPTPAATPAAPPGAAPLPSASEPGAQRPTPPQHHVIVTVTSNPPGANVSVDGKAYGQTPADIEWWGDQAAPGREVRFVLHKDGFERSTIVRSIVDERLTVDAQLVRAQPAVRSRPPRERSTTEPRGPVVVPDNFKDDPY
jgi:serine/threonine-protein kinase